MSSSPSSLQKTTMSAGKPKKHNGTKRTLSQTTTTTTTLQEPSGSLKGSLAVTSDERKRRKERKARFETDVSASRKAKTTTTVHKKKSGVDPLYRPLSSSGDNNNDDDSPHLSTVTTTSNNTEGGTSSSCLALDDTTTAAKTTTTTTTVVGRNPSLEKAYLRLTTFPDPEQVRPLSVLIKALAHIKNKYLQEEDFEWANEQLKSVRQDITVQRIRNPFVLEVYETHARILLEHGDLNEFNQCQTVIRSLCGQDHESDFTTANTTEHQTKEPQEALQQQQDAVPLQQSKLAADEFAGYSLLYALVRNSWLELNQALQRPLELAKQPPHPQMKPPNKKKKAKKRAASPQVRKQEQPTPDTASTKTNTGGPSFQHALCVVRAVVEDDFRTFFRLYENAPHMSAYIMDFLVKRVRESAYHRVIASYRPHVGVEQFREWLCLADLEQTRLFLQQQGAVFVKEFGIHHSFWVDCKASFVKQLSSTTTTTQQQQQAPHRSSSSSSLSEEEEDAGKPPSVE